MLNKEQIKTGNVGLVYVPFKLLKPATYISAPTRLVLGSKFSHAVLFWWDKGVLKVVEALPFRGVIETNYEEWIEQYPRHIKVLEWECESEKFKDEIGKKYDLAAALWSHLWYRITRKWNGRTGSNADKKRFCFELVLKAHNKENYWLGHPDLIK